MGNCPACLSGRYSMIHDIGSEEGDDEKMGELGRSSSSGGMKVVRGTDGKVFEYKTASNGSGDDDDAIDDRHMHRLRAKDVISKAQGPDEGSLLDELFDQSYTSMASTNHISNNSIENEKKKNKNEKSEEKGTYERKPLHPETLLKVSHVYYLRPTCAATTANYDRNILPNISGPATSATAAATKAATDQKKKKKKEKKVRFSDHVVFIEPPAPSSEYNHHRQPDYVWAPAQLASVLPNLAAAPLSKLENMAQAQNHVVGNDDDDHGVPINERQLAAEGPIVRVKLLLSKRQLCDLLAATGQCQYQEQQQYHSQLAAADVLAEKLVAPFPPPNSGAPHRPPASLSSLSHQQALTYTMRVS